MERVFITVKTYPTISTKYGELVCTAGIKEDGSWVRIYPVPFRLMHDDAKFSKYQWISLDLERKREDPRVESYRPRNLEDMRLEEKEMDWSFRWQIIEKAGVETNMRQLCDKAKRREQSLATFKPSRISKVTCESCASQWTDNQIATVRNLANQRTFFDTEKERTNYLNHAKKIPYRFYYHFEDGAGTKSKMMISDWETGMLYLNCFKLHKSEQTACEKVLEKYTLFIEQGNTHLFLGTISPQKNRAPDQFIIIGVLPLPKNLNKLLF